MSTQNPPHDSQQDLQQDLLLEATQPLAGAGRNPENYDEVPEYLCQSVPFAVPFLRLLLTTIFNIF